MSQLTRVQRLALWQDRFDRFLHANLTVAEFCRSESVSVPSFYHWKKQLAIPPSRKRNPKIPSANNTRFVPLVVHAVPASAKLNLPGGAAIELPGELGTKQLTDLILAVLKATDRSNRPAENA